MLNSSRAITKPNSNPLPLITFVLGTRPEAIKLAPVIIKFQTSCHFRTRVISTGQHPEMVASLMNFFNINIEKDLKLMVPNQSLISITSKIIEALEIEFSNYPPTFLMVQGDTNSALAGALAGFYSNIPVCHIEAGLRTDNLFEPYPEEANRRLISQISSINYAPTERSRQNLLKSNVSGDIYLTGNTVIDALLLASKKVKKLEIPNLNLNNKNLILTTVHRRENWGSKTIDIAKGIKKILDNFPDTILLLPMHPNKKVREPLINILGDHPRAILTKPLDYQELISAIKACYFLITDSGGLQEEAPSLGKPVLILRNVTERPEAIEEGTSELIGTDKNIIFNAASSLLSDSKKYLSMSKAINPFGDGKASEKILNHISKVLKI